MQVKKHKPYGVYEKYVKRPLDFICALGAVVCSSVLFMVIFDSCYFC